MFDIEKPTPKTQEQHEVSQVGKEQIINVDTTRQDEGLKVLSQYTGDRNWTPEEESRLRHKIDRRLMPLLCVTYGLQVWNLNYV